MQVQVDKWFRRGVILQWPEQSARVFAALYSDLLLPFMWA